MIHALILVLALLIGAVAGLRSMTAPAVVAAGALLGWVDLSAKWSEWVGHPITVAVLTVALVAELVGDQLPSTPSRKMPVPFIARLVSGGFAGAVIGSAYFHTYSAAGAGIVGAVLGTLAGAELRARLATATNGNDRPGAVGEDLVAVGGGFLIVYLVSLV